MGATGKTLRIVATASLALVVPGAEGGLARAEAVDGQRFRDWTVKCETTDAEHGRRCFLFQNLSRKEGDKTQRLMSTVVGRFGATAKLVMLFTVPLGVLLPAGAVVKVEGHDDEKQLSYRDCTRGGCRAAFELDDRWLGLLKAGSRATVTVRDGAQKAIALPLSLLGLSKGLDEIATP